MQDETAPIVKTMDFTCPYCHEAAFEILGTQWDVEAEKEEDAKVLVIRCLKCLNVYYHSISQEMCGLS